MTKPAILALFALPPLLAACSGGALTPESLADSYTLLRVDGAALPATIYQTTDSTVDVSGGSLSLLVNGQYTLIVDFRVSGDGAVVATPRLLDLGPYRVDGDFLFMQSTTPGKSYVGSIDGPTITVGLVSPFDPGSILDLEYRR